MEHVTIAVLFFILGIIFGKVSIKRDGRLIIDRDEYFVAITTKPEDLEKKKWLHLKVITK